MLSGSVVTVVKPAPKLFCETVVGNFSYGSKAAEPKNALLVDSFYLIVYLYVFFLPSSKIICYCKGTGTGEGTFTSKLYFCARIGTVI